MKNSRIILVAMVVLCLTVARTPTLRAESVRADAAKADAAKPEAAKAEAPPVSPGEVSNRLQELQDEMDRIQGEMSNLKKQLGVGTSTAATPAPAGQAAQTDTTPAAGATPAAPAAQAATPAAAAPAAPAAPAAEPPSALAAALGPMSVTGFVDGYYSYNFNHPRQSSPTVPGLSGPFLSNFRTFDGPANQFSLNMVELTIAKAPDAAASRLGYTLTFGFGNAENVVNSTDVGGLGYAQPIKEAYLSYLAPVGKGLQIDFGKFVTPAGAEVIETNGNWNYSRSLLFNYAIPFNHFGLRAKYTFNDKFSLTGYLVNGWNNIVENNTGKTLGASLAWTPNKKWTITENYLAGPEIPNDNSDWRQLTDTVIAYNATSKLSLMANYDYGRDSVLTAVATNSVFWQGVAAYFRYTFNDRYAIAGRYEYFDDHDGFNTGTRQGFNEFTATFERIVAKHLITRWEYRHDISNWAVFTKGGSASIDHQDTFTGGLVYSFDVKDLTSK